MNRSRSWTTAACLAVVIVASNWTYFRDYGFPRGSFYDEAIYIADAQKYLNGVFFMQDHPPLGKLLIALGERVFRLNPGEEDARFVSVTVAPEFPDGYSFLGYRLFPVLLAWWTAPILFLVFLDIAGRHDVALVLSCLYVFDNALIVHLRGALLEGPLLFFSTLAILLFLTIHRRADRPVPIALAGSFGASLALAITTKEAALILLLLVPALVYRFRGRGLVLARLLAVSAMAFALVYAAVWQVHFGLARRVNPSLPGGGYFDASPAYRAVLDRGEGGSWRRFPLALRESWAYTASWNRSLQDLDLCSPKEIGSPAYYWPFGARTINYRSETIDGRTFRYLYLQSNPIVWGIALIAALASLLVLVRAVALRRRPPELDLLGTFAAMYWCYIIGLSTMHRVLYLHSYLIVLLIAFAIAAVLVAGARPRLVTLLAISALIVAAYAFYYPLTYYRPLTEAQFARRVLVKAWDLRCGSCPPRREPGCQQPN